MKILTARFDTILWRFYLMMGIVIASFFLGVPYLSFLAFPIFVSALLGVSFRLNSPKEKASAIQKATIQTLDPMGKAA